MPAIPPEDKQKFEGGATRSQMKERFDLIPPEGERCVALRFGIGAVIHGENNWKSGGVEFIKGIINHLKAHIGHLITNLDEDDDVGAIIWAGMALAWFRVHKQREYENALLQLGGSVLTETDVITELNYEHRETWAEIPSLKGESGQFPLQCNWNSRQGRCLLTRNHTGDHKA